MVEQYIHYSPLPYQELFHSSDKFFDYLSAGYGAGKTYSLCMHAFKLMSDNPGLAGGLLAPTLKMFKRDVLPTFISICLENDIDYQYHKTDHYFTFPHTGTTLYVFHAEDDGQSIKGPNLAFMLINEVTLISKAAFDVALSRVRLKKAGRLQVAMSGTPEGFGWTYEYFIENPRADADVVFGDMRLNTHIAETYVKTLTETYDKNLVAQYVEGKFVNLVGNRAVYAFDRKNGILDPAVEKLPDHTIWVSMDFNVDPMSAVLWNRLGPNHKELLTAFDEIHLPNSNTPQFVKVLKEKVNPLEHDVVIFPDPAGNHRDTRGVLSDIDILRQAGFKDIRFKSRIASIRDCLNASNKLIEDKKIRINPKCKNFIADLEQCTMKPSTNEIDKSNSKRSHWLDGFKDMIDYEFPVRKPVLPRVERIR